MKTLQELRAEPHLSVSQLKTFMICPRKYALQYVEGLKPAFRPVAYALGTAWHHTIGYALVEHAEGKSNGNGKLHDHLKDGISRQLNGNGVPVLFDEDEDEGVLVDRAMRMLDVFVAEVPLPEQVLGVEVPFSLDLSYPESGEHPLPLIGAMDAIVEGPTIWELKTSKRRWSQHQLDYDLQPTAYRLGARECGHEAEVQLIVTTKAKSPQVQSEPVTRGLSDEADLIHIVISVSRAVKAGVDHPVRGWQCQGCPYSTVC